MDKGHNYIGLDQPRYMPGSPWYDSVGILNTETHMQLMLWVSPSVPHCISNPSWNPPDLSIIQQLKGQYLQSKDPFALFFSDIVGIPSVWMDHVLDVKPFE